MTAEEKADNLESNILIRWRECQGNFDPRPLIAAALREAEAAGYERGVRDCAVIANKWILGVTDESGVEHLSEFSRCAETIWNAILDLLPPAPEAK